MEKDPVKKYEYHIVYNQEVRKPEIKSSTREGQNKKMKCLGSPSDQDPHLIFSN